MDKSSIKKWRDNVRVIPQWQKLIAPEIKEDAEAAIYDALLHETTDCRISKKRK